MNILNEVTALIEKNKAKVKFASFASATKADLIMLVNRRAKLTNTLCVKGNMGAIFNVPIKTYNNVKDCWQQLQANNFGVYLADTCAKTDYLNFKYASKAALVIASERYEISNQWY